MTTYTKDPSAVLDFAWDWSAWLADSETISSHTVTVPDASGLVVDSDSEASGVVTAWLSAGTVSPGAHAVVCRIVTNQGRTDERTLPLYVRDR